METVDEDATEIRCPSCGGLNPPRAKFCLECGTRMPVVKAEISGDRRVVSVVFADLSGFTSFSERTDPEEVRALADEAAGRLGEIVVRYGGVVDKIIGDCVMAVFGAPESHEDDPERAVRAALDMQAYVTEHRDKFAGLPLRIGVNTGETMWAPVGPGGQYTVLGDTVNTAARLQSAAAKGEVLVGEQTFKATAEAIDLESVPPITAKGKDEPVPAWRAVSVLGTSIPRPKTAAPLIGRAAEFDRLWELWERTRTESRPNLATLLGAAGIGKSRLLHELTDRLEGQADVHWGRCLPYGEGITYWPVVELIKSAAGILHTDEGPDMQAKLGALLESLGSENLDELRTMAAALANLVAVPSTPRGRYTVSDITQAELHWGVRRVFQMLAGQRPIALVFEDLHWAEPTLLELIEFMLAGADAPILLLATARPEMAEDKPAILATSWNRRVVSLHALTDDEARAMLQELLGAVDIPPERVADLMKASGGNPLFLEETVRMLGDAALDREVEGGVERAADVVAVPDSLQSLIGARLDRLPQGERRVAQLGSVVGAEFWPGAVRHLDAVDDVEGRLDTLEARDLVHEHALSSVAGEREYAFKHMLIRDVAYGRLPKAERSLLHARCGQWVGGLPTPDEFVEIVAYHLEQACRLAQEVQRSTAEPPPLLAAVRALARAGEKAQAREGTREADGFYSRALELVGTKLPETATELKLKRSRTLTGLGQFDTAYESLTAVADDAGSLDRMDLRCGALLGLGNLDQKKSLPEAAREHLSEAASLARTVGDPALRIKTAYEFASFRYDFEGESDQAAADLREGLAQAEAFDDLELRLEGHLRLGSLLLNVGDFEEAEQELERCIALSSQKGSLREQTRATHFLGHVKFYLGELEEAQRLATQAVSWLDRMADRYFELQNFRLLAGIALSRDDLPSAERWLQEALPRAVESGGWLLVDINRYMAETLARQGRPKEATEAALRATSAAPEGDGYAQGSARIAEGFAAAVAGDEDGVRKAFLEAIPLVEAQDYDIGVAEIEMSFARCMAALGLADDARERLERARTIAGPIGAVGLVQEVDRITVGLGGTGQ